MQTQSRRSYQLRRDFCALFGETVDCVSAFLLGFPISAPSTCLSQWERWQPIRLTERVIFFPLRQKTEFFASSPIGGAKWRCSNAVNILPGMGDSRIYLFRAYPRK